jgi:hypothetical protein
MTTLLEMKRRRYAWLGLLAAWALALIFSYSWSGRAERSGRIKIERDVSDTVGIASAKTETSYDPYFDRANYFGSIVPPATNAVARSRYLRKFMTRSISSNLWGPADAGFAFRLHVEHHWPGAAAFMR